MISRRKFLASVGAAALGALSLAGCGSSSASSSAASSGSSPALKSIDLTDAVIYDDANITLTVTKLYEHKVDWREEDGGPAVEKCVTFAVKNKTDKKATIYFKSSYIGDESAWLCVCGGSQSIDAGKTNQLSYYIGRPDGSKHKPLESLDDVYKFNGHFTVNQTQADGLGKTIVDTTYSLEGLKK